MMPQRLRSASAGFVLGIVVLIIVTAILGGAVAAWRTSRATPGFAEQLSDARSQISKLRADNVTLNSQNQQLLDQNETLLTQSARQQRQLAIFVRYLREHGLAVPTVVNPNTPATPEPAPGGSPRPKVRKHPRASQSPSPASGPHTGTPTPTPGTPGPVPGVICTALPALCP